YYKNVKVLHGHFKIHQRADGMVQTANGNIITGLNLDLTTTVNENEALANALSFMNAKKYLWQNEVSENELKRTENNVNATYFPKGELVFAPANYDVTYLAADYRLTWQFTIYSDDINVAAKCVFVDALSGKVVYHYDISMSCSIGTSTTTWNGSPTISTRLSGGLYQSHNDCQATDIITYNCNGGAQSNTYYTDANNAWTAASQASSAQAQYGARGTYNYYNGVHTRLSWNGSSGDMISYNNAFAGSNNACWGCTGNSTIYYAGNTSAATDDWNTLDIMGHEFTHGVTQDEAGLIYNKESGALNESFSDIFGDMVESYNTGINDWLVGDDRGAIRSFLNPNSYGDPDTYNGTNYKTTIGCTPSSANDQCGVHSNSSIQNRMFYLLSEGGSGTNDLGVEFNVTGIGRFVARDIGYRALVLYLSGSNGFIDAREAWLRAALDLYGNCSNEIIQVGNAWRAVGVESQSAQYNKNICGNYPALGTYAQAIHQLSAANGCATNITASASTVYFSATDRVVMYPGFHAISGSKFYAYIEPCAITLIKKAATDTRSDAEKGFVNKGSDHLQKASTIDKIAIAPNPFNNEITLSFEMEKSATVKVELYTALGKLVTTLLQDNTINAGRHNFTYSTGHITSGVYFIKIEIDGQATVKKIIKM
ncbi:MAG TPA: M4 family metallopeptidase, partial [Bacteroidia bacterium]|nr:M4 family metallopeptidase [Bacteroidia bacterium]